MNRELNVGTLTMLLDEIDVGDFGFEIGLVGHDERRRDTSVAIVVHDDLSRNLVALRESNFRMVCRLKHVGRVVAVGIDHLDTIDEEYVLVLRPIGIDIVELDRELEIGTETYGHLGRGDELRNREYVDLIGCLVGTSGALEGGVYGILEVVLEEAAQLVGRLRAWRHLWVQRARVK